MAICTGCGAEAFALKVASWQDVTDSGWSGAWCGGPSVSCFGAVCGACLDVLEYRADDGQIHSITAAAVSATAGEIVAAWVGGASSLDQIADALNGKEWGPDTCEIIAGIVRASGRVVGDVVGGAA
jgi:hypothetical protein